MARFYMMWDAIPEGGGDLVKTLHRGFDELAKTDQRLATDDDHISRVNLPKSILDGISREKRLNIVNDDQGYVREAHFVLTNAAASRAGHVQSSGFSC